jgi:hypothetical protein
MPNGSPGFFFLKKTFRMNEQPVSQIPFKGDWGRFPNKQICEDCTGGKIEKVSEPVQVYTACQFVKPQNSVPLSSKSPFTSKIRIIL